MMKRLVLLLFVFLILASTITAFSAQEISLYIDDEIIKCDVPPKIVNNRTLVPVRAIFDAFGATVKWNERLKQVTIISTKEIVLTINSKNALVDGKRVTMDTNAQIVDSRTLVPIRFISETLGYDVEWNSKKQRVYIYSPEEEQQPIITDISLTEKTKYNNTFEIEYNGDEEPNVFYLAYSDCIVMDFYDAEFSMPDAKIRIETDFVNEVRYAIHDEYARVVIECNGKQGYTTSLKNGIFKIVVGSNDEDFEDVFDDKEENKDKEDNSANSSENNKDDEEKELSDEEIKAITTAFLKTRDEKNLVVVIDAGHGGSDPGAVYVDNKGNDVYEKTPNLYISLELAKILDKRGIKCVMIRDDDTYVDLIERSTIANNLDADLFISIHNNAIANEDVSGCMVLYNGDITFSKYSVTGKDVATLINEQIKDIVPVKDRGIVSRPGLSVLKRTVMPAVLIECAFGTNEYDLSLLLDEDKLDLFALAIANGVEETLDIMKDRIIEAKKK